MYFRVSTLGNKQWQRLNGTTFFNLCQLSKINWKMA